MIKLNRTTAAAALGGGLVASVITFGVAQDLALSASGNANPNSNSNANATPKPKSLTVTQISSTQVAPGREGSITLKVSNPNNQPVVLTDVKSTVSSIGSGSDKSIPACNKAWISIAPWSGNQTIKADDDAIVTVATTFVNSATVNQSNCKGVAFTFSFTATGRQA